MEESTFKKHIYNPKKKIYIQPQKSFLFYHYFGINDHHLLIGDVNEYFVMYNNFLTSNPPRFYLTLFHYQ